MEQAAFAPKNKPVLATRFGAQLLALEVMGKLWRSNSAMVLLPKDATCHLSCGLLLQQFLILPILKKPHALHQ